MPGTPQNVSATTPLHADVTAKELALEQTFRHVDDTVEIDLHKAIINYPEVDYGIDPDRLIFAQWAELHTYCLADHKLGQAAWNEVLSLASQRSLGWTNAFIRSLTAVDSATNTITINSSRLNTLLLLKNSYGLKGADLSKALVSPYKDHVSPDNNLLLAVERSTKFAVDEVPRHIYMVGNAVVPANINVGTIVIQNHNDACTFVTASWINPAGTDPVSVQIDKTDFSNEFFKKLGTVGDNTADITRLKKILSEKKCISNITETFNDVLLDQMHDFLNTVSLQSIAWLNELFSENLLSFSMLYSLCFEQREEGNAPDNNDLMQWLEGWINICNTQKIPSRTVNANHNLVSLKNIIKYGFSPCTSKYIRENKLSFKEGLQDQIAEDLIDLDSSKESQLTTSATATNEVGQPKYTWPTDTQYGYHLQLATPPDEVPNNTIYVHLGNAGKDNEFLQYTVRNALDVSVTGILTTDNIPHDLYASIKNKIKNTSVSQQLTIEERSAVMQVTFAKQHTQSYQDDAERRYILSRLLEILSADRLQFYHQHHRLTALISWVKEGKLSLADIEKYDQFHGHESPPRRLPRLLAGYRDNKAPPLTQEMIIAYDLHDFDPKNIPARAELVDLNRNTKGIDRSDAVNTAAKIAFQKIKAEHAAADDYLKAHFETVIKPIATKRAKLFHEMHALMHAIEMNEASGKKKGLLERLYYLFHKTPSEELVIVRDKIAFFSGALEFMCSKYNEKIHGLNKDRSDGLAPSSEINGNRHITAKGQCYFGDYQMKFALWPRELHASRQYLYESLGSVSFVDNRTNFFAGPHVTCKKPALNKARDSVSSFLKTLAGLTIAPVTLFTAFASSKFKETFFASQSSNCFTKAQHQEETLLSTLHEKLEKRSGPIVSN